MRNITVTVSDQAYRQARVWAAKRDTSVSAVVEYLISHLPGLPIAKIAFPLDNPHSAKPAAPPTEAVLSEISPPQTLHS